MYKNSIIVLIEKDGKPLRESHGNQVFLPDYSEYAIRIKNDKWQRALAKITVDGTDILGGQEIIIPQRSSVNVERFITDGDLSKGNKLKFVPLGDSRVQDPSSMENGLIEVEVWFEKQPQITWSFNNVWPSYDDSGSWPYKPPFKKYTRKSNMFPSVDTMYRWSDASEHGNMTLSSDASQQSYGTVSCMSRQQVASPGPAGHAGATVEGGHSSQSFGVGSFGEKEYPSTIIKLWLRGIDPASAPVYTDEKLHCTQCGKVVGFNDRYCSRCGNPVQIN